MSPCSGITTKRVISYCSPHQHATKDSAMGLALHMKITRSSPPLGRCDPAILPLPGQAFSISCVFSCPCVGSVSMDSAFCFYTK